MESEFQTVAHEKVYGFQEKNKQSGWRIYYANIALGYCKIWSGIGSGNVTYLRI